MDSFKLIRLAGLYRKAVSIGGHGPSGQVPRKRTNVRGAELANYLREGYKKVHNQEPTLEMLGMAYSQCMHEQGGRFWNYNFGNIKGSHNGKYIVHTKAQGLTEYTATGERIDIKADKFRAYDNPVDGAVDYWKLLGRKRYAGSLGWFAAGDPVSSAMKLSDEGYYTGNRVAYAKNMSKFFKRFMEEIAPKMQGLQSAPKPPPGPPPEFKSQKKGKVRAIPEELAAIQQQYAYKGTPAQQPTQAPAATPAAAPAAAPATPTPGAPQGFDQLMSVLFA
jgi:hypothetical protein